VPRGTAARLPKAAQRQAIGAVLAPLWRRVFGDVRRGPVHVRVTAGSPYEELLRLARDIAADLIVLGRGDTGRTVSLTRLRDLLRQAPCPVLIVHPSGRAAVASSSARYGNTARA
jgi:nucleotide-binding universal stress UspA family protein